MLVLFGPSGAGKTTILRQIAGLERPDAGAIRFDGDVWCDTAQGVWRPPQSRRDRRRLSGTDALPAPHRPRKHPYGIRVRPGSDPASGTGSDPGLTLIERWQELRGCWGSRISRIAIRGRCRAGKRSASRSPARSRRIRGCSCSTSRSPRSTRRRGCGCGARCAPCCRRPARRRSWSRTIAPRRWPWATPSPWSSAAACARSVPSAMCSAGPPTSRSRRRSASKRSCRPRVAGSSGGLVEVVGGRRAPARGRTRADRGGAAVYACIRAEDVTLETRAAGQASARNHLARARRRDRVRGADRARDARLRVSARRADHAPVAGRARASRRARR